MPKPLIISNGEIQQATLLEVNQIKISQLTLFEKSTNIGGNDTDTLLLIHSNQDHGSTIFTDSSGTTNILSITGGVVHSVESPVFNTFSSKSSIYFPNNNSSLIVNSNANLTLGTSDFTIDFWAKIDNGVILFDCRVTNGLDSLALFYSISGNGLYLIHEAVIHFVSFKPTNFFHCAFVRTEGYLNAYINGIIAYSGPDSFNYPTSNWYIGSHNQADPSNNPTNPESFYEQGLFGYINEFRISKKARWTNNFIPPKVPYDTNALQLYLIDEQGNSREIG